MAGDNVKSLHTAAPTRTDTMSFMHFYKEMVIIRKQSLAAEASFS